MNVTTILDTLRLMSDSEYQNSMRRFAIPNENALGVRMPNIRAYAKEIDLSLSLVNDLWNTGILEAQILASICANPKEISKANVIQWIETFDSWAICDQTCGNLIKRMPQHMDIYFYCLDNDNTFVKRTAFTLLAIFAMHKKDADISFFKDRLKEIIEKIDDERNFVKKAVSWSLRQIGKKGLMYKELIFDFMNEYPYKQTKATKWIFKDVQKELEKRYMNTL